MAKQISKIAFDPNRPKCREGIISQPLKNGMVFVRHPKFSSQVLNQQSWAFLQMCDGRALPELNEEIARNLGFRISLDQLRSSVNEFATTGVFEGSSPLIRNYRLVDATALLRRLSPLNRLLATNWFAAVTLIALLACLALLIVDWSRFIDAVAQATREHPVSTLMLYYVTFIPIALIHEVGHALVIAGNGGEVPEIVLRSDAHFAVVTNKTVLKEKRDQLWYLSMGTVTDIYIWLSLLIGFHYSSNYLLLMFLLPQTFYFLLYSYSIFKGSDFLKAIAAWHGQPVPSDPWKFIRDNWRKRPEQASTRKLLYVMTVSLAVKIAATVFVIWTFAVVEFRVLILYAIYKALVYALGNWQNWMRRIRSLKLVAQESNTTRARV
jgi:hypothetical protein